MTDTGRWEAAFENAIMHGGFLSKEYRLFRSGCIKFHWFTYEVYGRSYI